MRFITVLFISCFLFFACGKEEKKPAAGSSGGGGGSAGPPTPTTAPTLPVATGGDLCNLQTSYNYTDFGGNVTLDSVVFASFYSAPPSSVAPTNISGGTVTINGQVLPGTGPLYYLPTPSVSLRGPLTWSVSGSGTVTAFAQTFKPSYPSYKGASLLPDSISVLAGTTVTISGVSNTQDGISVSLYGSSSGTSKYLMTSSGTVFFSAADLSGFTAGQTLNLSVSFSNFFTATHKGVKRGFSNTLNYQKFVHLY